MTKTVLHTVYLCLGTNLGDRKINLKNAIDRIQEHGGEVSGRSGIYISSAWGYESENDFYNQCLKIETPLNPDTLMDLLLAIEEDVGRKRESVAYQDRAIDIDVLFYENQVIQTKKLSIPHPRISERRFVLQPLTEIARDYTHPIIGKTIEELLKECKDEGGVKRI